MGAAGEARRAIQSHTVAKSEVQRLSGGGAGHGLTTILAKFSLSDGNSLSTRSALPTYK
jgi:hypothetical protein